MAKILSDRDLQKLLGKSIIGANSSCLRPNSYILRLGSKGEFINTEKKFEISELGRKRGIKLQPGHAIGITSLETIDFRPETVEGIYPDVIYMEY
ncbi:MAG: hypothetical protein R1F54_07320 [Candidatus Zeuxoniibacter abyssi]|nr:MAG: hypothetical protein R1F54_07320 [Candidatus Persebacteraceae bacterium AB1(2)]